MFALVRIQSLWSTEPNTSFRFKLANLFGSSSHPSDPSPMPASLAPAGAPSPRSGQAARGSLTSHRHTSIATHMRIYGGVPTSWGVPLRHDYSGIHIRRRLKSHLVIRILRRCEHRKDCTACRTIPGDILHFPDTKAPHNSQRTTLRPPVTHRWLRELPYCWCTTYFARGHTRAFGAHAS